MIDALTAWLREQIDEDERVVKAAGERVNWTGGVQTPLEPVYAWRVEGERVYDAAGEVVVYDEGSPREAEAEHIAHFDPQRQLDEVAAKRAILDHAERWAQTLHATPDGWTDTSATAYRMAMEWTAGALALAYASRPGYREEWKP